MLDREIMLCEELSEFPHYVLPLPCNVCVNVTSERRQGDSVTVSHNYPSVVVKLLNKSIKMTKFMHKCRFYVRLCYVKDYVYKISHQTFKMSDD